MERLILEKFDWFVDFVTPVDFLQIVNFLSFHRQKAKFKLNFQYFAILTVKIENTDDQVLLDRYIDLESKLASCLQHHRLSLFRPRVLALALISLEFEKEQVQQIQMETDWLPLISYLQQLAKVRYSFFMKIDKRIFCRLGRKRCVSLLSRFDCSFDSIL